MQFKRLTERLAISDKLSYIFFFLVIVVITDLNSFFWAAPQGIHVARQTDSFSFSFFYFLADSHFLHPGNLNLESIDGKCAGEFPLFYYLTSKLYFLTGLSFIPLKLLTIFSLFVIFVYSTKSIVLISESRVLGISLAALFLSSTVLLYYSIVVLPDIHALAFCCVSTFYFFRFKKSNSNSHLAKMYIFGAFAALFKASFFMYVSSFFLVLMLADIKEKTFFKHNLVWFLGSLLTIATWYLYANYYNQVNNDFYYTTKPKPFWLESGERIRLAWGFINGYWYPKYYYQSTFHFFFVMIGVYLLLYKKDKLKLFLLFVLLSANVTYVLLFLTQFIHHDYYFIVIIPTFLILVSISTTELLRRTQKKGWIKYLIHTFIIVLTFLSLLYAKLNLNRRFDNVLDSSSLVSFQLMGAAAALDSLQISRDKTFIIIGDPSHNASLVFLNRFGWTYKEFPADSSQLKERMHIADYLVVLSPSQRDLPNYLGFLRGQESFAYKHNNFYKLNK
jgi:hypothetical protein